MAALITNYQFDYEEENNASLPNDDDSDIEENKHTCELCGYQTSRKNNLKLHEQAIHEGKKYQCYQCDYQTTKKSILVTHQQSLHEGMNTDATSVIFKQQQKVTLLDIRSQYIYGKKISL